MGESPEPEEGAILMVDHERNHCPLLDSPCRRDCAWFHSFVQMDEDGMSQDDYCAVNVIVDYLVVGSGEAEPV